MPGAVYVRVQVPFFLPVTFQPEPDFLTVQAPFALIFTGIPAVLVPLIVNDFLRFTVFFAPAQLWGCRTGAGGAAGGATGGAVGGVVGGATTAGSRSVVVAAVPGPNPLVGRTVRV